MRTKIIGIMGPGVGATAQDCENAYQLGQLIALAGWVLLTGGRNVGVMDAAAQGAKQENGLTIGILPTDDPNTISMAIDIPIITNMGNARNQINVLSSDVVIACGMGTGTASEIALALKAEKKVILLSNHKESKVFFQNLAPTNILIAESPQIAINLIKNL